MRHPRQTCHHHAQGHPTRQEDPWRESLSPALARAPSLATIKKLPHKQTVFLKTTKIAMPTGRNLDSVLIQLRFRNLRLVQTDLFVKVGLIRAMPPLIDQAKGRDEYSPLESVLLVRFSYD